MVILVSEEQVREAEAQAQRAEQVRAQADAELTHAPHSRRAAEAAVDATQKAAAATRRLERLREEFEESEAARAADRAEAEKAATKEVRAAAKDLTGARQSLTAAAAAAQDALATLVQATAVYNALAAHHADALAAVGLDLAGGRNGGGRGLSGPMVVVDGEGHAPAEPGAVVGAVVARLAASLPRSHRLAVAARYLPGGDRAVALLAGVPEPVVEWSAPVRPVGRGKAA
ncbi:hypothetical protein [Streptomyces sp. GbtcB6]|uniref:hypothetical protein n=1 Tax=Streptomyces sp. GbtcB6 TaxID=2824751 RepID=UPI001C30C049|nr:hypothetical protein [Streptomyces sp. GbtcB6]